MHAVGELVQHGKFGFGRVTAQTDKCVTVLFFADGAVQEFDYPGSFCNELRFAEPMAQQEMEYEIESGRANRACADAAQTFDF